MEIGYDMAWFNTTEVGRLQLECTNYCNAACPQCDRAYRDKESLNNSYHTLENYKEWFGKYKWDNLELIHFCGNVDEPTVNPEIIDIVEWVYTLSDKIKRIDISTNGGTRDLSFWKKLGKISKETKKLKVIWGIDGLEDTNHIYRRNVDWNILQSNFKAYIEAGGRAVWQCIIFGHNNHQLEDIKKRVDSEGFERLMLIHSDRTEVSTIDNFKDKEIVIPEWHDTRYADKIDDVSYFETSSTDKEISRVECIAKPNSNDDNFHSKFGNIYVDAEGYVTPCCWIGTDRDKLWNVHDVDKKLHNLHHIPLKDIMTGYWKYIDDSMQTYSTCVTMCKKRNRNAHI
jgi:MoaA/NifB/PqqE/SkfB family radical SAM enzyme